MRFINIQPSPGKSVTAPIHYSVCFKAEESLFLFPWFFFFLHFLRFVHLFVVQRGWVSHPATLAGICVVFLLPSWSHSFPKNNPALLIWLSISLTLSEAFGSNYQNSGVPQISMFPMRGLACTGFAKWAWCQVHGDDGWEQPLGQQWHLATKCHHFRSPLAVGNLKHISWVKHWCVRLTM